MNAERFKKLLKPLSLVIALSALLTSSDYNDYNIEKLVYSAVNPVATDTLNLESGWNLFSFSVEPPDPRVSEVLSSIAGKYDLVKGIENGTEVIFDPSSPGTSTLQSLNPLLGYYLHMLSADDLIITGTETSKDTPILLREGINLISFLPDEEQSIEDALSSIIGEVAFVKAIDHNGIAHGQGANGGLSYDPTLPQFSTLKKCQKGFGYWIKLKEAASLSYPKDPEEARQMVEQGQQSLESGDIPDARTSFEEALVANPFNPEANTGIALVTLVEQVEATQEAINDGKTFRENIDFTVAGEARNDLLKLIDQSVLLPYVGLSSNGGEQPQLPDIGSTIARGVFDTFVNITGESKRAFSQNSITALNEITSFTDEILTTVDTALAFIETAEKNPNTSFRISANGFDGLITNDLDGDGVPDVNSSNDDDFFLIDQSDLLILDGQLSSIKEHLNIILAYNLDVPADFQPTSNGDRTFTPDEYFPPGPLFTINPERKEALMTAGQALAESRRKTIRGINSTLAEPRDEHEFFPVNSDLQLREELQKLVSNPNAIDITEHEAIFNGTTLIDLSQEPFNLQGQSIRMNLPAFFNNPPDDLRDYLYTIDLQANDVTFQDPTWGGIWPDADIDNLLEFLLEQGGQGGAKISTMNQRLLELNTSQCTFPGGFIGSLFEISFDYSDPNGGVTAGTVANVSYAFLPSGSTGSFTIPNPEIGGDGFSGRILTLHCYFFASQTSADVTVSITDARGQTSNSLVITIPRPEGANVPPPTGAGKVGRPFSAKAGPLH